MSYPEIQLTRNLRKNILQGDPWVYRQAINDPGTRLDPQIVKVLDPKKQLLGWGFYSSKNPIALRIFSLEKKAPNKFFFAQKMWKAFEMRQPVRSISTTCYRLFNGEGDGLPGLVCDIYGAVAVLQFDGVEATQYWDHEMVAEWLLKNAGVDSVFFKPRHDMNLDFKVWGAELNPIDIRVVENNCKFSVDIQGGQKTGFFLDQRDNREYVKSLSPEKTVLNLFSYTGGFSVYAGMGRANQVCSVDIASEAIKSAEINWALNGLKAGAHEGVAADVFEYIHGGSQKFDIVVCDPPSLAKSERHKDQAFQKYIETFAAAAKKVEKGGHLILSSCSSHISFEDFYQIMSESLSKSRTKGRVLRISGQGSDHPFPHACSHLRYLKFMDILLDG